MIFVLTFGLFLFTNFFVTVGLPAITIPLLSRLLINRKKDKLPSLKPFIFTLLAGGGVANVVWWFFLKGKVYYEWDSMPFPPYSFFDYEKPFFGGMSPSWLAEGWKLWHLLVIWIVMTAGIYISAIAVALFKQKHVPKVGIYRKIIFVSVCILIIFACIKQNFTAILFQSYFTKTYRFAEINTPCTKRKQDEPLILWNYNGVNGEILTDLSGNNKRVAFTKDRQIRSHTAIFSPDETKVLTRWHWNDWWISCLHSDGALKIRLPKFSLNRYALPYSGPSWSPDGNKLVVNLYGDLVIVDAVTKTFQTIKSQVAIRDNHVDMTAKGRDLKIPAYEVGSAYWARDGRIYYTSFEGNQTALHRYNPQDLSDMVILTTDNELELVSGNPTGDYLLVKTHTRGADRSFDASTERYILLDKNGQQAGPKLDTPIKSNVIWSPSGRYFSYKGHINPIKPTLIHDVNSTEKFDISALTKNAFRNTNHILGSEILPAEVIDFIDEERVLVHLYFPEEIIDYQYALANLIINFHTGESVILQDYPRGQETGKELFPLKVIH